jgi:TIR domain
MVTTSSPKNPKLWITYAWVDNGKGDFSYLVRELRDVGVEAAYDRIALIPGRHLWRQIAEQITSNDLAGWAYLLTPSSIRSQACQEELAYALDQALGVRGDDFPLLGLMHGVAIADVPLPLRVRLCVDLAHGSWQEEVVAALQNRAPNRNTTPTSAYLWRIHRPYPHLSGRTAIEVRPRFGQVHYWRAAVPFGTTLLAWGSGPSEGGALSPIKTMAIEGGDGEVDGRRVSWFGAGDRLSPGTSAYLVFRDNVPDLVGFGFATEPFGAPEEMEFQRA